MSMATSQVICTKSKPNCTACPLQMECEYARSGGEHWRENVQSASRTASSASHTAKGAEPALQPGTRDTAVEDQFLAVHLPGDLEGLVSELLHKGHRLGRYSSETNARSLR